MNEIPRRVVTSLAVAFVAALAISVPAQAIKLDNKELKARWEGRRYFLCCNLYYNDEEIQNINYHVGLMIPYGTPVTIIKVRKDYVHIDTGRERVVIVFDFKSKYTFVDDYARILLKEEDPRLVPRDSDVQAAIKDARVEVGMTRDEVLIALGIPPAHRTPSLNARTWMYWVSKRREFTVTFDSDGRVERIGGDVAMTRNQPIRTNKTTIKRELE